MSMDSAQLLISYCDFYCSRISHSFTDQLQGKMQKFNCLFNYLLVYFDKMGLCALSGLANCKSNLGLMVHRLLHCSQACNRSHDRNCLTLSRKSYSYSLYVYTFFHLLKSIPSSLLFGCYLDITSCLLQDLNRNISSLLFLLLRR